MTDPATGVESGPSVSFAFNLAKIADHGEDSDPILREGPDLGLVGVFDGMGGAGGTVYETPDGPRSGAYIASRIARDVVEERMLDLLEPNWTLNGDRAAADLHDAIARALQTRLEELKAPTSRLKSKLLRALPTTMAVVALQRSSRSRDRWVAHVFWAGDSRAYLCTADGMMQLSADDVRDEGDALENLRRDSVVSNALSADTDFHINYRRTEIEAPFLLTCATDGAFGYLRSPMHFEKMMLETLASARSPEAWSAAVQTEVSAVTGDDAAMALIGVGAEFAGFRRLLEPRLATLTGEFIAPIESSYEAAVEAEERFRAANERQAAVLSERWGAYKVGYEARLNSPALDQDVSAIAEDDSATTPKWRTRDEDRVDEPADELRLTPTAPDGSASPADDASPMPDLAELREAGAE